MLDTNAMAALDLLPLGGSSSGSAAAGGVVMSSSSAAAAKGHQGGPSISSLFGLLDRTASAAGKRRLRQWMCRWEFKKELC